MGSVTRRSNNKTKEPSVRPFEPAPSARASEDDGTDGRTDGPAPPPRPVPRQATTRELVPATPGTTLLLAISAEHPRYLLAGQTLEDQGLMVTGLLASGWTGEQIARALTSRPLPEPGQITTSVGAIIASRLRDLARSPVPGTTAAVAAADAGAAAPADPPRLTRAQLIEKCAECDQYGFTPDNKPCRHESLPAPPAAPF
jgi:hypothetical protein